MLEVVRGLALELIVRVLRAREGSPELEKGLGVKAEALMGSVLRGLTWGNEKAWVASAR